MTRALLAELVILGDCGGTSGSGPANRQVYRDELKEAFDEIELGMPEQLALAKIPLRPATSGDGCGSPDWR